MFSAKYIIYVYIFIKFTFLLNHYIVKIPQGNDFLRLLARAFISQNPGIALRHVMGFLAARLGIGLVELHRRFAVCFDEPASVAQVQTLLSD